MIGWCNEELLITMTTDTKIETYLDRVRDKLYNKIVHRPFHVYIDIAHSTFVLPSTCLYDPHVFMLMFRLFFNNNVNNLFSPCDTF